MEAQEIEKLDRKRYNSWLVQLIGTALWGGVVIYKRLTGGDSTALDIAMVAGLALILVGWALNRIVRQATARDSRLKEALNNELYKLYNYKAHVWGYWVMAFSLFALAYVVRLEDVRLVALISFVLSGLAALVARLVYHRGSHE